MKTGKDVAVSSDAGRLFALWLGLPGDPDARELARRLAHLNDLDDVTRRRVAKEMRACLDDMLGDDRDEAVA